MAAHVLSHVIDGTADERTVATIKVPNAKRNERTITAYLIHAKAIKLCLTCALEVS